MASCHRSSIKGKTGGRKGKKKKKRKRFNLWSLHECLQIGCKLRWTMFFVNTIQVFMTILIFEL
jgi:hypothetical protein